MKTEMFTEDTYEGCTRKEWPKGPWDNEPDKAQWIDEKTQYPCLIVRNRLGALCGYVGISKGHKLYEEDYDTPEIDVHGGLTYSKHCQENGKICHDTTKEDKVWWFGFDCNHAWDIAPGMLALEEKFKFPKINWGQKNFYRDFDYVKKEIESLARQLKELE